MKTRFTLYAAAVVLVVTTQAHAQDDLDALSKSLAATPTPAATTTPKSAQVQQPRAAKSTPAAPRSTPAPAAPSEAKPELSRARFVGQDDLAGLAGQKLSNVYLTGTYKATGNKTAGRYEFTTRNVILGTVVRGSTRIMVRFPKTPNPQLLASGNSSQWDKSSPLHLERVEKFDGGFVAYVTDTP